MTVQAPETTTASDIAVTSGHGQGHGQRVALVGRLDVHSVPDLRLALHRAIDEQAGPITIDLCEAMIGDATGLGMLVEAHRRSRRAGRPMAFENPCERGARLLRAVRLHPAPARHSVG